MAVGLFGHRQGEARSGPGQELGIQGLNGLRPVGKSLPFLNLNILICKMELSPPPHTHTRVVVEGVNSCRVLSPGLAHSKCSVKGCYMSLAL